MFYEEKIIDGVLCFRNSPNGNFRPMSAELIAEKFKRFEMLISEKYDQMDKMYSKDEVIVLLNKLDKDASIDDHSTVGKRYLTIWVEENLTK